MTLEATVSKLMWILAQTRQEQAIKRMFETPVERDLI